MIQLGAKRAGDAFSGGVVFAVILASDMNRDQKLRNEYCDSGDPCAALRAPLAHPPQMHGLEVLRRPLRVHAIVMTCFGQPLREQPAQHKPIRVGGDVVEAEVFSLRSWRYLPSFLEAGFALLCREKACDPTVCP